MKISLLTLLFGFCTYIGYGQNDRYPPKSVSGSFQVDYPHSHPSHWVQSSVGWSVSFQDNDHNNGQVIAYYDMSGRHIDTHIPYENHDVPHTVRDHMHDSYGGSGHYEYTRIDHYGENHVYMTHYKHKKQYKIVYMDNDGHEREYKDMHN